MGVSVTSDEASASELRAGGSKHCPDAVLSGSAMGTIWMRAERSGTSGWNGTLTRIGWVALEFMKYGFKLTRMKWICWEALPEPAYQHFMIKLDSLTSSEFVLLKMEVTRVFHGQIVVLGIGEQLVRPVIVTFNNLSGKHDFLTYCHQVHGTA